MNTRPLSIRCAPCGQEAKVETSRQQAARKGAARNAHTT